jgi:hypothetical protein
MGGPRGQATTATSRRQQLFSSCEIPVVRWARCPADHALLPLIVGQLPHVRAVGAHHENLAVCLSPAPGKQRLVLPSHPGTVKRDPLAVGRPDRVGVVPAGARELAELGTIRANGVDIELSVREAGESYAIASRGPRLGQSSWPTSCVSTRRVESPLFATAICPASSGCLECPGLLCHRPSMTRRVTTTDWPHRSDLCAPRCRRSRSRGVLAVRPASLGQPAPVRMYDVDGGCLHQLPSSTCAADVAEKRRVPVGGEGDPFTVR